MVAFLVRAAGFAGVVTSGLVSLALSGCASGPSTGAADAAAKRYAERGYIVEKRFATQLTHQTWTVGEQPFAVTLLIPEGASRFPLVLYLPGLGESADAAAKWRQSWAEAGYAVLSVQPAEVGETLWRSPRARRGDFGAIARDQFSTLALARRLEWLRQDLAEIRRRQERGETPFDRVDLTRVAVAGFDLGAQTAMAAAGEHIEGVEPPSLSLPLRAAIILSPYSDFSRTSFAARYATIGLPVLSVTGGEDADSYGLVNAPMLRRAPYTYMPAGEKYLLVLAGATHAQISGGDTPETPPVKTRETSESGSDDDRAGSGQPEGRRRGDGGGMGRSRGERGAGRGGSPTSSMRAGGLDRVASARQIAAVQGITTAFLDATLKGDPVAKEWLAKDASRWLGESAELMSK